jgi:adenosyl cobinamide kinase/adenosyl cobinamide phosphate guanylyltransferase
MLTFILGVSKSGKSVYAETLVQDEPGSTLYIATLPNILIYEEIITAHEKRRPADWDLLELTGDPSDDLNDLRKIIEEYDNILLDGIALYLIRVIELQNESLSFYKEKLKNIVDVLAQKSGSVIIVDHIVPGNASKEQQTAVRHVHKIISVKADVITYFHEGKPENVSKKTLYGIERSAARGY